MNLSWLGNIASFGWPAVDGTTKMALTVDRNSAGVYRTPHEKAARIKASKRNKAAKKARKRNRR